MIAESLAGTGRRYVQLQARMYPQGLHVQGKGVNVNRDYGVAVTFPIHSELRNYLYKVEDASARLDSLAGTGKKYFYLQAVLNRRDNNLLIHFQVPFAESYNRDYGAAFDVPVASATELAVFIASELAGMDDC